MPEQFLARGRHGIGFPPETASDRQTRSDPRSLLDEIPPMQPLRRPLWKHALLQTSKDEEESAPARHRLRQSLFLPGSFSTAPSHPSIIRMKKDRIPSCRNSGIGFPQSSSPDSDITHFEPVKCSKRGPGSNSMTNVIRRSSSTQFSNSR